VGRVGSVRSLDVVNPLDLRQNGFVGEDFADFRQPLWIAKALYNFGNVASFWNEAGIEMFFSRTAGRRSRRPTSCSGETFKIHANQSVPGGSSTATCRYPSARSATRGRSCASGRTGKIPPPWSKTGRYALGLHCIASKNDVPPSELDTRAFMAGVRLLGHVRQRVLHVELPLQALRRASASAIASQLFDRSQPGTGTVLPSVLGAR